jgi:HAD superfamily hydrolase (TIGR01509 family)
MSAVVFDCDGVLVDSEPISERAWTEVLARYGYAPSAADFAACRGRASPDTYAHYAGRVALPDYDEVVAAVDAVRHEAYDAGLPPFADAAAAVRGLAMAGVPLAVASSSARHNLDRKLAVSGLARYFEVTVAGTEVAAGKPAPDLYLAACAGLGMGPARCLAVEDAVAGAVAASAAGMRVVLVDRTGGAVDPRFATTSALDAEQLMMWLPV